MIGCFRAFQCRSAEGNTFNSTLAPPAIAHWPMQPGYTPCLAQTLTSPQYSARTWYSTLNTNVSELCRYLQPARNLPSRRETVSGSCYKRLFFLTACRHHTPRLFGPEKARFSQHSLSSTIAQRRRPGVWALLGSSGFGLVSTALHHTHRNAQTVISFVS